MSPRATQAPRPARALCEQCGGHGAVMDGDRVNARGRTVPNFVPCRWCDGRDRATPLVEAQASDG